MDKLFILFHYVVVVEHRKSKLVLEHLSLQILEHHVSELKLLVSRHVLCMRQLSVKCHDGSECLTFGDEAELARGKVVVLTMTVHL